MERYPVSTLVTCFLHNVASDVYLYMLYYACNPHNVYAVHDIVYVNRELAPALRISHNVLCIPDVKVYIRIFPESIACSERLQKLKKNRFVYTEIPDMCLPNSVVCIVLGYPRCVPFLHGLGIHTLHNINKPCKGGYYLY